MDLNCLEPHTSAAGAIPWLLLRFDDLGPSNFGDPGLGVRAGVWV